MSQLFDDINAAWRTIAAHLPLLKELLEEEPDEMTQEFYDGLVELKNEHPVKFEDVEPVEMPEGPLKKHMLVMKLTKPFWKIIGTMMKQNREPQN